MTDWLLLDSARRLLADACTYETVQAAESTGWSEPIWDALEQSGYTDTTSLELEDAVGLLALAGEHAAPVPLADSSPESGVTSVASLAGFAGVESGVTSPVRLAGFDRIRRPRGGRNAIPASFK